MGRSNPAGGGKPIPHQIDDPMLHALCPDLSEWPQRWQIDDGDIDFGHDLLNVLMPFLQHLLAGDLSRKTLARHRDHLWMLGGEIVRRLYNDPRLRRQPPAAVLLHYIDDEGGPLIYPSITEAQQRAFDGTCRKLHRFLSELGTAE